MKLTRKQELALIDVGLAKVLDSLILPKKSPKKKKFIPNNTGRKWTPAQRKRFQATMKKVWAEKRNGS